MRALLFALLACPLLLAQNRPFTIRVDVPLVTVDFTVTDADGQPVTDLNRYDFDILDNGKPRPIQNFSRVQTPYHMLLLLDCSASTQSRVNLLISSMARFADQLRPQDRAAIAMFGTEIEVVADWNGESKHVNTADSPACHGTNLYSALLWGAQKFRGIDGRRGVVVFTDGQESDIPRRNVKVDGVTVRRIVTPAEDSEFQKTLRTLRESNLPYYFVAMDTDLNPGKDYGGPVPDLQQIRARMELLARETGGRIVFPMTTGEVVPLILQIGRDLGISYSLGFAPENDKDTTPHTIEIRPRGEERYVVHLNKSSYVIK